MKFLGILCLVFLGGQLFATVESHDLCPKIHKVADDLCSLLRGVKLIRQGPIRHQVPHLIWKLLTAGIAPTRVYSLLCILQRSGRLGGIPVLGGEGCLLKKLLLSRMPVPHIIRCLNGKIGHMLHRFATVGMTGVIPRLPHFHVPHKLMPIPGLVRRILHLLANPALTLKFWLRHLPRRFVPMMKPMISAGFLSLSRPLFQQVPRLLLELIRHGDHPKSILMFFASLSGYGMLGPLDHYDVHRNPLIKLLTLQRPAHHLLRLLTGEIGHALHHIVGIPMLAGLPMHLVMPPRPFLRDFFPWGGRHPHLPIHPHHPHFPHHPHHPHHPHFPHFGGHGPVIHKPHHHGFHGFPFDDEDIFGSHGMRPHHHHHHGHHGHGHPHGHGHGHGPSHPHGSGHQPGHGHPHGPGHGHGHGHPHGPGHGHGHGHPHGPGHGHGHSHPHGHGHGHPHSPGHGHGHGHPHGPGHHHGHFPHLTWDDVPHIHDAVHHLGIPHLHLHSPERLPHRPMMPSLPGLPHLGIKPWGKFPGIEMPRIVCRECTVV